MPITKNNYHTVGEIRQFIALNLIPLKKKLGNEFSLAVLRHHVKLLLTLREFDLEKEPRRAANREPILRIDHQINNAIYKWRPSNALIVKADKKNFYKFAKPASQKSVTTTNDRNLEVKNDRMEKIIAGQQLKDWYEQNGISRSTAYLLLAIAEVKPEPRRPPGGGKPVSWLSLDDIERLAPLVNRFKAGESLVDIANSAFISIPKVQSSPPIQTAVELPAAACIIHTPQSSPMLTTEDWQLIEAKMRAIVSEAIAAPSKSLNKTRAKTEYDYHTAQEIRLAIACNIDHLKEQLGDQFNISVLRHHLKKLLPLREGDLQEIGRPSKNAVVLRIDHQIANAVHGWPSSLGTPVLIVKADRREWYKFNEPSQNTLDLN